MDFSFLSLVPVSLNFFFFQNVSRLKRFYQAWEIWIQTWVGVRSKFVIGRRDKHALGVTLCRCTNLNIVSLFGSQTAWDTTNHRHYSTKTLFTWSGGPRSSGVRFFCFVSPRAWKQKKLTPPDRGPPLHVNRPLENQNRPTRRHKHSMAIGKRMTVKTGLIGNS